jgi:serine/threonine protein kinase
MSSSSGPFGEERLPRRIGTKYRPMRVLGRGGMSVVYEVEHGLTRDRLALKVLKRSAHLDPVALARFRREARMSALMKSAHIVRVLDADIAPELGGAPFLVMDLLAGADLATVARREPQSPETVVEWLRQAARAVDLAHHNGVVHRDLKPENLFLVQSKGGPPLIKVLDFGIACIPSLDDERGTKTGVLVGTPLFMSPEQASGAEVGPPTDMWSMAMCAFRLLSGRAYWNAGNMTMLLAQIVYEEILPPSRRELDLGASFDEWFLRSCAKDPAKRWESAGAQIEGLAAALGFPVQELPAIACDQSAAFDVTPDEAAPSFDESDGRSHSLGPAVTSTPAAKLNRLGPLGIAFGLASTTAALLFRQGSIQTPNDAHAGALVAPHASASSIAAPIGRDVHGAFETKTGPTPLVESHPRGQHTTITPGSASPVLAPPKPSMRRTMATARHDERIRAEAPARPPSSSSPAAVIDPEPDPLADAD